VPDKHRAAAEVAVTAPPPWVLQCRVVTITLPQPAVVAVSLPPRVPVVLRWPRSG
jgi:hypothetical protein